MDFVTDDDVDQSADGETDAAGDPSAAQDLFVEGAAKSGIGLTQAPELGQQVGERTFGGVGGSGPDLLVHTR